jgi:hypothetical protein
MGEFFRERLPDALAYFVDQGLPLTAKGKWRTTRCDFHGGSDSMRVNIEAGSWVCMACGAKGGDLLSYHMQLHGMEFVAAAKALGAWEENDKLVRRQKPAPLPARAALEVIRQESMLAAVAAANVAHGVTLSDLDRTRLLQAAGRINRIVEVFHG